MLSLDRSTWNRVKLGDVVKPSKEKVDPTSGKVDRYIAGEHMDSDNLKIHRWGEVGVKDLGPAFHRRFRPGQVLYGSRRTYLRKVSVAEFDGVCANTTFVLETAEKSELLQEFLPFVMTSEPFHAFAIGESKGSVNPYVNWSDIAKFEFDLPPMEEQKRIAALLWAVERHARNLADLRTVSATAASQFAGEALDNLGWETSVGDVIDKDRPLCYGVVQPGVDVEDGVGLVRVLDLESGAPKMGRLKRVSQEIDDQYRRSRIRQGDVLVSVVGTIGRTWTVTSEFEGCNIARALARISPESSKMTPAFLELALNTRRVQDSLLREAFESARKTLNLSALSKVMLPSATLEVQSRIVADHRYLADAARSVADAGAATLSLRAALLSSIFGDS